MNSRDELEFRLALAAGFLQEAEQDIGLQRWRSCVDNAQLAAENAGEAVLALFGIPPKTHEPAKEMAALLRKSELPADVQGMVGEMLPDLLTLGRAEHLMTDYGDETTYTLPWEIFTGESAREALEKARRALSSARGIIALARSRGPRPPGR
ncbi:MAG: HEPN domain-containing protein [Thermodesulfobacteriota bacterium]